MRKILIASLAFVVSAVAGTILLILAAIGIGSIQLLLFQRSHSGIGAVAGGISEASVTLVPILCGVIGVILTLHHIDRRKP